MNLTADAHPIHLHLVQFQLLEPAELQLQHLRGGLQCGLPCGGYDSDDRACRIRPASTFLAMGRRSTTTRATPARWVATPTSPPEARRQAPLPARPGQPSTAAGERLEGHGHRVPGPGYPHPVRWAPTDISGDHCSGQCQLPLRPERRPWLRLALPHRGPRGQRDDAPNRGHAEQGGSGPWLHERHGLLESSGETFLVSVRSGGRRRRPPLSL